jgi:Bax protein
MHKIIKSAIVTLTVTFVTVLFIVTVQKYLGTDPSSVKKLNVNLKIFQLPELSTSKSPVPDFAIYTNVIEKKIAFFAYLLPEIRRQNAIVVKEREAVFALQRQYTENAQFIANELEVFNFLKKKYQLTKSSHLEAQDILTELTIRVDVIPEALVLVQAANESGWGVSRFAQEGYNFFGLWCFKNGCGFVPKQRNVGAIHEVAKFDDLSHSVMTYARNLNRLGPYQQLRNIRHKLRQKQQVITAEALVVGLMSYSERGQDYIDELLSMLRVNTKHMGLENK